MSKRTRPPALDNIDWLTEDQKSDLRLKFSFLWRVDKETPEVNGDHCFVWTGTIDQNGYGRFSLGKRDGRLVMTSAPRAGYLLNVGPMPRPLEPDHLCRNPTCVNLKHIEAVTPAINIRRSRRCTDLSPTCGKGHPRSGDNLRLYEREGYHRPVRACKECQRLQNLKTNAKSRYKRLIKHIAWG